MSEATATDPHEVTTALPCPREDARAPAASSLSVRHRIAARAASAP
ncbi:hypothetical protein AB0E83_29740 [Streptomyces sp. NPDC035033]